MSEPALELKSVTRIFHQAGVELNVFHDISFNLAPGEIVALVGARKNSSRLLLCIAKLTHCQRLLPTPGPFAKMDIGSSARGRRPSRATAIAASPATHAPKDRQIR